MRVARLEKSRLQREIIGRAPLAALKTAQDDLPGSIWPPNAARPQRFAFGEAVAELRTLAAGRWVQFSASASLVNLIVPISGSVQVVAGEKTLEGEPGAAVLLGRSDATRCIWSGESILVLRLGRMGLQAVASQLLQYPCRVTGQVARLPWAADAPFAFVVAALRARMGSVSPAPSEEGERLEQAVLAAVVEAGRDVRYGQTVFTVAGSVKRAMDHIRARPDGDLAPGELAAVAGVTVAVLRRNFKGCLGLSLSEFVQQTRLDWIRGRLGSAMEGRSIAELAEAGGFRSTGALARAYRRRFSETPSQTRTRAFAAKRG